jgi:nucleoside-diphosphate-sugar epimerase
MKTNTVLLTGTTGYLGSKILNELAKQSDTHIIACVRNGASERLDTIKKQFDENSTAATLEFYVSDLTDPDPFRDLSAQAITHIIHTSADTRFNISADIADTLNRDGSRKVFDLAKRAANLQSLIYLSSVYSCGLVEGQVEEALFANTPQFSNHYERSKFESEQLLATEYIDLPWQILRVATVIADDSSGRTGQINVFHNSARLIFNGLISILPGTPSTSLYFVPADLVAKASTQLCFNGITHTVKHLCFPKAANLTVQSVIDTMMETFAQDERFVARRILPPLLTDLANFIAVSEVIDKGFAGIVLKQAVESIKPFAPQMFSDKDFRVSLPAFTHFDNDNFQREMLRNALHYLMRDVWLSRKGST